MFAEYVEAKGDRGRMTWKCSKCGIINRDKYDTCAACKEPKGLGMSEGSELSEAPKQKLKISGRPSSVSKPPEVAEHPSKAAEHHLETAEHHFGTLEHYPEAGAPEHHFGASEHFPGTGTPEHHFGMPDRPPGVSFNPSDEVKPSPYRTRNIWIAILGIFVLIIIINNAVRCNQAARYAEDLFYNIPTEITPIEFEWDTD